MSRRMTITTRTIPISPEGYAPHEREYGQAGNAPIRSKINRITMMVVKDMNE
jgi:hypothetical protein